MTARTYYNVNNNSRGRGYAPRTIGVGRRSVAARPNRMETDNLVSALQQLYKLDNSQSHLLLKLWSNSQAGGFQPPMQQQMQHNQLHQLQQLLMQQQQQQQQHHQQHQHQHQQQQQPRQPRQYNPVVHQPNASNVKQTNNKLPSTHYPNLILEASVNPSPTEKSWKQQQMDAQRKGYLTNLKAKDIPEELFYCHLCEHRCATQQSFSGHMKSYNHVCMMYEEMKLHNTCMNYLMIKAKQLERRRGVQSNVNCRFCNVKVTGTLQEHQLQPIHKEMVEFQKLRCCQELFTAKSAYLNHLHSLPHKKVANEEKQRMVTLLESQPATPVLGDDEAHKDLCTQLKEDLDILKGTEEKYSVDALPSPNSGELFGTWHLKVQELHFCHSCDVTFPSRDDVLKHHCDSLSHINSLAKFKRTEKYRYYVALKKKHMAAGSTSSDDEQKNEEGQEDNLNTNILDNDDNDDDVVEEGSSSELESGDEDDWQNVREGSDGGSNSDVETDNSDKEETENEVKEGKTAKEGKSSNEVKEGKTAKEGKSSNEVKNKESK